MNTKRIWIWSLLFGILATVVLYFAVFTNQTTPSPAEETVKKKEKVSNSVAKAAEKEKIKEIKKRDIKNTMVEVSEGKRAISLKVGVEQGVSGYIEPNAKVDIIAYETTIDPKTKKEFRSAVLTLQNVKVLASGKASNNEEEALQYDTVTVEVTPEQGIEISLASKDKNGFYLMLRNSKDNSETQNISATREVVEGDGK